MAWILCLVSTVIQADCVAIEVLSFRLNYQTFCRPLVIVAGFKPASASESICQAGFRVLAGKPAKQSASLPTA